MDRMIPSCKRFYADKFIGFRPDDGLIVGDDLALGQCCVEVR